MYQVKVIIKDVITQEIISTLEARRVLVEEDDFQYTTIDNDEGEAFLESHTSLVTAQENLWEE